jgi:hypothetical protein
MVRDIDASFFHKIKLKYATHHLIPTIEIFTRQKNKKSGIIIFTGLDETSRSASIYQNK